MQIIDGNGPDGIGELVVCDECGRWVKATVTLGRAPTMLEEPAAVCVECLRAALEMMAMRPRQPQE